jgi:hypothetical protein
MNEKGLATLKICEQKLNYLNYSKRTSDNYLSHINAVFIQIKKPNQKIRFFYFISENISYKLQHLSV